MPGDLLYVTLAYLYERSERKAGERAEEERIRLSVLRTERMPALRDRKARGPVGYVESDEWNAYLAGESDDVPRTNLQVGHREEAAALERIDRSDAWAAIVAADSRRRPGSLPPKGFVPTAEQVQAGRQWWALRCAPAHVSYAYRSAVHAGTDAGPLTDFSPTDDEVKAAKQFAILFYAHKSARERIHGRTRTSLARFRPTPADLETGKANMRRAHTHDGKWWKHPDRDRERDWREMVRARFSS